MDETQDLMATTATAATGPPPSRGADRHVAVTAAVTVPKAARRTGVGQSQRRFRYRTGPTRARDVCRHLQPWCDQFKSKTINRLAFPAAAADPLHKPEPCPDTALAAFAQLSALRMSARRCLISLISDDTEYVLVDITQSMSLQHDALIEDPKSRMWIGTCSFPRCQGPNDAALELWEKARDMREEPSEGDYFYTQGNSPHWSIVSDARADAQLQKLEFMRRTPSTRFFASVPLRSAHGSVLGALTIMDDLPRLGLSCTEMAFLEDIADTVVEHLAATMILAQSQRSERLIQAVGLFNAGKVSLRDWWLAQEDARILGTGRHAYKGDEVDRQARLNAEFGTQKKRNDHLRPEPTPQADYFNRGHAGSAVPLAQTRIERPTAPRRSVRSGVTAGEPFDLVSSFTDCYARASNLLRESIGADGVVFLDATNAQSSLLRANGEDSDTGYMSNAISAASEASDSGSEGRGWCRVQGFSNRTESSARGSTSDTGGIKIGDALCKRLIKRYPNGFVFHYDPTGDAHASSDESNSDTASSELSAERKQRKRDGAALRRAFNGARTVALYPLWDEANERWRSCVFTWSTSEDRYFTRDEDLTYLTTFGHSLLAGLSRLESLAADNAKGTFISSISHELRSPLHGVMAGLEFLQDSQLNSYQQEMTHAISMAARTLLDTIDHVLDYSKIASNGRARKTLARAFTATTSKDPVPARGSFDEAHAIHKVDLARLVEEVVETTVAAYRSQYQSPLSPVETPRPATARSAISEETRALQSVTRSDVAVTCNITARDNWVAELPPGGLTRVITNLLGNALKYTSEGTVSVHLKAGASVSMDEREKCPITLIIQDTGIGITEVFQANSLFKPFTQEDPHSTGTGLGLSIVRQIANEMGARLDLTSTRGAGTTVTLSFVVNIVSKDKIDKGSRLEDFYSGSARKLDVSRFHLICADDQTSAHGDKDFAIGNSVLRLAKQWLNCTISNGPTIPSVEGNSICAILEDDLSALQAGNPELLLSMLRSAAKDHSHILVLGQSIQSLSPNVWLGSDIAITPVFVHQPIGPRKLLRAIVSDHSSIESGPPSAYVGPSDQRSDVPPRAPSSFSREAISNAFRFEQATPSVSITPYEPITTESTSSDGQSTSLRTDLSSVRWRTTSSSRRSVYTSDLGTESGPSSTAGGTTKLAKAAALTENGIMDAEVDRNVVLLVEDNSINMKFLVALMRKLKLTHNCASNGREAVDLYRKNPRIYLLVLMDISMPVMDGYAATSKIRAFEKKRPQLARVTIVALTGVTSCEAKARAFSSGVDEFYPKPVRMKELKELVDRIME